MQRPKPATALYSAAHFAVDLCCAAAMFQQAGKGGGALLLMLYNFCAFAMQLPLGVLADRLGHGPLLAATGCAMVGGAWLAAPAPLLMAALTGLGNGAFHIGAGVEVLNMSQDKAALLGVFVSPGAIGIFLGTVYGPALPHLPLWCAGTMLCCAAAILLLMGRGGAAGREFALPSPSPLLPLAGLLLVVCLRSYCGAILSFPWKEGLWAWAALLAVALGKALGGFACDRLGAIRASAASLGLCSLLFLFSQSSPILGTLAVLLFNMTMPITLWAAARLLSGCHGAAFGLLTFGLFMGLCPAYFGFDWAGGWAYALLSALSLGLLLPSLPRQKELSHEQ